MHTTYRQAISTDLPELVNLLHLLFFIEEDFNYSADLQLRGLEMILLSEKSTAIVAHHGEQIVGMITGQITISTAEGAPSLLIEDLVIAEAFRGTGIGKNLLNHIGEWGSHHKATRMQLLVDRNNSEALDFYQYNNWQPTQLICLRKYKDTNSDE